MQHLPCCEHLFIYQRRQLAVVSSVRQACQPAGRLPEGATVQEHTQQGIDSRQQQRPGQQRMQVGHCS